MKTKKIALRYGVVETQRQQRSVKGTKAAHPDASRTAARSQLCRSHGNFTDTIGNHYACLL